MNQEDEEIHIPVLCTECEHEILDHFEDDYGYLYCDQKDSRNNPCNCGNNTGR